VAQLRHQGKQPNLARRDLPTVDDAACSMAQAEQARHLPVHQLAQRYTVLTYTSLHPETLPETAGRVLGSHKSAQLLRGRLLRAHRHVSTGVYWVVLSLD